MKLCMGCMNQMDDHLKVCPHCGFDEASLRQESYYLSPGTIIGGKYILGKVLSYGGHTVSYLGMDAEVNRKVVIKEYLPSDFSTRSEGETEITIYSGEAQVQFEKGLTNFLNEANRIGALGKIDGIVRVYDCVAENDTGYVITEYIEGKTLKEILDSGKKYNVNEAVSLITKILKGLSKVHPMNIVHCDIAPETIMITDSGEIILLDFGATRYVTTANSKSLAIILKQGYAPEEQYRSSGKRGPWTDVYSLGAVMYRMITGIVPQESVERALVDELKEPSKLGISIPVNVENALMNALNIYAEERTKSADAFLRELRDPGTKRVKVARKNNEVGKFPVWAKVLVASLLLMVVAGGVFLIRNPHGGKGGNAKEKKYLLEDLSGSTYKENMLPGIEISPRYIYDPSNDGMIIRQDIPGANYTTGEYKGECGGSIITVEGDKASGSLVVYVASKDYVAYSDIRDKWKMKANNMQNALGLDKELTNGVKDDDKGYYYYDIMELVVDSKKITSKEIKEDTDDSYIKISDISKINYYAKNFFYWKNLEDYEGENIDKIKNQPEYKLNSYNKPEIDNWDGDITGDRAIVDNAWYSFDAEAGYILKQTRKNQEVDCSKGLDIPLFYVVGDKGHIEKNGTGKTVKDSIESLGFTQKIEFTGAGEDGKVSSIKVKGNEDDSKFINAEDEKQFFTKEADITFVITTYTPTTESSRSSGGSSTTTEGDLQIKED